MDLYSKIVTNFTRNEQLIRSSKIIPGHPPGFRSLADTSVYRVRSRVVPSPSPLLRSARHVDIATVVYRITQQTTGPPIVNRVQRHSEYRRSRRQRSAGALLQLVGDVDHGYRGWITRQLASLTSTQKFLKSMKIKLNNMSDGFKRG